MSTNDHPVSTFENQTPSVSPGTYSPITVYMEDTVGAVFLGILAGILMIGWMSAERRYRVLKTQTEAANGSH